MKRQGERWSDNVCSGVCVGDRKRERERDI